MRIYVAGPLTATDEYEELQNIRQAMDVGAQLIAMGYVVFVPHLSYYMNRWGNESGHYTISYEAWMSQDFSWIEACDAVYVIAPSPGTDREIQFAKERNIPVINSIISARALLSKVNTDESGAL